MCLGVTGKVLSLGRKGTHSDALPFLLSLVLNIYVVSGAMAAVSAS
jgi:hypothetical protein